MVEGPRGRKAASTDTAHDPRSCISFGDCRTYCWGKPDMSLLQHRTQPRILLGSGPPLPSLVPRGMFVPVLCWGSFFMAGPHPRRSCGTQSQALCGPTILLTPASCRPWAAIPLAAFPAFQVGRNHPASQDLHFCGPSSARHFHGYETGHRVDAEVQLLGNLPFLELAQLPCKTWLGLCPGQEQLVADKYLLVILVNVSSLYDDFLRCAKLFISFDPICLVLL
nr:uncharacterized protein LOC127482625 [Oryctolagus cuniculus]